MKPRIFIGSSVEALPVAYAIQQNLEFDANVTIWNQGVFELSSNALDDLIKALDKFDFGIFIFKPDDISQIKNNTQSTVRDNVIFELGLFIGKLGKERVFFVLPKDAKDFHLPTDLLGVNSGKYEENREDGNMQASLGPFCNQVRIKLKNFTYTSLYDLEHESAEAKRIAIEKPFGWQHLLSAELFDNKVIPIHQSYYEIENKLVFVKTRVYTTDEFYAWFEEMTDDLKKFSSLFMELIKIYNASFGLGATPKILDIKNAVDRLIAFCKDLIAWEYRVQETKPPEDLSKVTIAMVGWTKVLFSQATTIPLEYRKLIKMVEANPQVKVKPIELIIEPPDNMVEVLQFVAKYYKRRKA